MTEFLDDRKESIPFFRIPPMLGHLVEFFPQFNESIRLRSLVGSQNKDLESYYISLFLSLLYKYA